jgi:hypothetical protein
MDISNITINEFKDFVGTGIFTVKFVKADGSVRVMNAMLKVSKYVKGTDPDGTEKRRQTNEANMRIVCYEMKGTSNRIQEENYRMLNLSPDKLISLSARGQTFVNPKLQHLV